MAITDQEKQDIIDGLLDVIRANGLDYSGQTIAFSDNFNIAQTEREKIKIPAIDERSSTPVHGNVDLEALLTAYGVTHVEEIASDISTNYMKKTADSDLDMGGYNVNNAGNLAPAGYGLGEAEGRTITALTDLNRYGFYYLPANNGITPTNNANWGGVYIGATTSYGTLIAGNASGLAILSRNASWGTEWHRISTFPFSDTTKDNRINAMGSNYIRYENGLQICWGYTESADRPCHVTFAQQFTSIFYVNATGKGATNFIYLGGTANVTTTGMDIYRFSIATSGSLIENNNGSRIEYLVIGKWK